MPSLVRYEKQEVGQNGGQSSNFKFLERLLQATALTETFQSLGYFRGLLVLSMCKVSFDYNNRKWVKLAF